MLRLRYQLGIQMELLDVQTDSQRRKMRWRFKFGIISIQIFKVLRLDVISKGERVG